MDYLQTIGIQRWQPSPAYFDKTQSANQENSELNDESHTSLAADLSEEANQSQHTQHTQHSEEQQQPITTSQSGNKSSNKTESQTENQPESQLEPSQDSAALLSSDSANLQSNDIDISTAHQQQPQEQIAPELTPLGQTPSEQISSENSYTMLLEQHQNGTLCTSCASQGYLLGEGQKSTEQEQPKWLFICEQPTANNLTHQSYYQGRSGQLLDAMLAALGLDKADVYVTSLNKCINANDHSATARQCSLLLEAEIKQTGASYIVGFGQQVAQFVLKRNDNIDVLCQQVHTYFPTGATFVPSHALPDLLDQPQQKRVTWRNLCDAIKG